MTMPHPGARVLVDAGNRLLGKVPATLDTGSIEAQDGTYGIVTVRTASATLTVFLTAAELREWAQVLEAAASQLAGCALAQATPQDLSLLAQLARKRGQA